MISCSHWGMFPDEFCEDRGREAVIATFGEPMVGKYRADYSPLAADEIAAGIWELVEINRHSRPIYQRMNFGPNLP